MITVDQAPCEMLAWDTAFFGFHIARVRGDVLAQEKIQHIDAWCRQNRIRCLYFLACSDDADTTRLAEDNCFRLVDIRMTFEYKVPDPYVSMDGPPTCAAVIRPARLEDIGPLQSIARKSHRDTRFYYDTNFARHLCEALYETWVKTSCEGYADLVLVAEVDEVPVGYIACHLDKETRTGRIGLVAVDEQAQGRSIGKGLVWGALEWFLAQGMRQVLIQTQGRNYAAQRLYQRCGFLTLEVQLWYHKWYTYPETADRGTDEFIQNPIQ